MPRTLHIDATRGASAAGILAALVDLGVPPSPILRAVGSMELPVEMRITTCADGTTVRLLPEHHGVLLRPREVTHFFDRESFTGTPARLAADVLGRLLLAEAHASRPREGGILEQEADAGVLMSLAGIALGLDHLGVERVTSTRIGVPHDPPAVLVELLGDVAEALDFGAGETTPDGAAVLRSLALDADLGAREPSWRGVVSRGRACDAQGASLSLGEALEGSVQGWT